MQPEVRGLQFIRVLNHQYAHRFKDIKFKDCIGLHELKQTKVLCLFTNTTTCARKTKWFSAEKERGNMLFECEGISLWHRFLHTTSFSCSILTTKGVISYLTQLRRDASFFLFLNFVAITTRL